LNQLCEGFISIPEQI